MPTRKTAPRPDAFTRQYMETALWSSTDESDDRGGVPLDKNYSISDISAKTRKDMIADCKQFQKVAAKAGIELDGPKETQAGHDFWLTRNRHGAGFMDGHWYMPIAGFLTDLSHSFGRVDLYVSRGKIYSSP